LTLESEVLAVVVVGVVVRGVEAAELAEDASGFVGDLVGDCSNLIRNWDWETKSSSNIRAKIIATQDLK